MFRDNSMIMNENNFFTKLIHSKSFLDFISLVASFSITLIFYLKTDIMNYTHPHFSNPWDHHKYIFMAETNPFDFHIAPFCWRVLVPFLASIMPFELITNFLVITLTSISLTGYVMYKIGEIVFNERLWSFVLMLSYFSIGFTTKFLIYDFWLVDPLAYLLITVGIYSILKRNEGMFVVVTTLGALTKEIVLFILPLYYTLNTKKLFDINLLINTIKYSLTSILVLIIIRLLIPAWNDDPTYLNSLPLHIKLVHLNSSDYDYMKAFCEIGIFRIKNFSLEFLYSITLYVFGVFMFVMVINIRKLAVKLLQYLPFLILIYSQILFAVNTDRLVAAAFPAILVLSISTLKIWFDKIQIGKFVIIIFVSTLLIMNLRSGIFYGNWEIYRQIALLVLLWFIVKIYNKIIK